MFLSDELVHSQNSFVIFIHFLSLLCQLLYVTLSHLSHTHQWGWELIAFHQTQIFAWLLITAQFAISTQIKAQDISQ